MSACTIDSHDELASDLHREKCLRISTEKELRNCMYALDKKNYASEIRYKESEKFREKARLRCIDLEFIIKILIEKIKETKK